MSLELKFTFGEAKERLIVGSLQAQVNVFCQRCLKPLAIALADDIELALVRDEEAALRLDARLDLRESQARSGGIDRRTIDFMHADSELSRKWRLHDSEGLCNR